MARRKPRRRLKRLASGLVVAALVLAVVTALLPTLVSRGLGLGLITGAIESHVRGSVEIRTLDLSWLGAQSVGAFRIIDASGREAVNLDVSLDASLLALALGRVERLDVHLAGRITSELRDDGGTSIMDLAVAGSPGGDPDDGPPAGSKPPFGGWPSLNLTVTGLDVVLELEGDGGQSTITLDGVTGLVGYAPGGASGGLIDIDLRSRTRADGLDGSFVFKVTARDLVDADGAIAPHGASIDAVLRLDSVPMPFDERVERISLLEVHARSADLAEQVDVDIELETVLVGAEASTLTGAFSLTAPIAPGGALNVGLDTVRGELTGRRVPTSLLAPMLAGRFPIDLGRDLGPVVDVRARFAPTGAAEGTTAITLTATAEHASIDLAATVGPDGAVVGDHLRGAADLHHDLVAALASRWTAAPARVRIEMDSFRLPPRGEGGTLDLATVSFAGSIVVEGPVNLVNVPGLTAPVTVNGARVDLEAAALGESVAIAGAIDVAGGRIEIDAAIAGVLDSGGVPALAEATPRGRITITDLDATILRGLLAPPGDARPPSAAATVLLQELEAGPASATLEMDGSEAGLDATIDLLTSHGHARTTLVYGDDVLSVNGSSLEFTVTPELAAAAQSGVAEPLALAEPADVSVTIEPFTLPGGSWPPAGPVRGSAIVRRPATGEDVARMSFDLTTRADDESVALEGTVALDRARLSAIEAILGVEPDRGDAGRPGLTITGDVRLRASLRRFRIPSALIRGEPFDPAAIDVDVALSGGSLTLADANGRVTTIDGLTIRLRGQDLAEGLSFELDASTRADGVDAAGALAINGRCTGLVSADSTLDLAGARLDADATAKHVPTVIADSFFGLRGLLVAAIGSEAYAKVTMKDFSPDTGSVAGRLEATNGFLEGRLLNGSRTLRTVTDEPLHGELAFTEPLRMQLLAKIHPILADVRHVEERIRFRVPGAAVVPVDGDLTRLDADLEVTVGDVEFAPGSIALSLITAFEAGHETVEGSIEPIVAHVRAGIVTFEPFAVHIDDFALRLHEGTVNLVTGIVDLRGDIPLDALALKIRELEGYTTDVVIPVVFRGPAATAKLELGEGADEMIAKLLVNIGIQRAIEEIGGEDLPKEIGEIGKILGDIFGGKKDKKKGG